MGVDIRAKHEGVKSYTFGTGQFANLRKRVAYIALKDERPLYDEWLATTPKTPRQELSRKCKALYDAAGDGVYNFVVQSDIEGEIDVQQCKEIYELIKDVNEDFSLCYLFYRKPEARDDFKNLLKDAIDHDCGIEWR